MKRIGILLAVIAVAVVAFLTLRSSGQAQIRTQFRENRESYAAVAKWMIDLGGSYGWVNLPKKQQDLCGHSNALRLGSQGNYCILFPVGEDSDGVVYIAYTEEPGVEMESIRDDFFTIERLEPHWQICGAF